MTTEKLLYARKGRYVAVKTFTIESLPQSGRLIASGHVNTVKNEVQSALEIVQE